MNKTIINNKVYTELISTVNDVLNLDIKGNTRKVNYVYGRMIYYKILRSLEYSYQAIADTLNKNHATVIHALNTFDDLVEYDDNLFNQYELVKKIYFSEEESHPYFHKSHSSLLNEAFSLEKQNKSLNLFVRRLKNSLNKTERYNKIIGQLEERSLKEDDLEYVSKKLNHILNGIPTKRR